ncbi:PREDICTED: alpha-N-acetylgalactosaminide alpha-2,6-sialyltransferase 5-like [Branchiostoma belcheri]|uniref:Alpha-N-acetylgalactosaminide alpha-2,6-sialyltransferase 5-like n=1 Tax=Branchiostoma belcheri TaxID=7741 RepID=A0A6P4Y9Z0_BRABE|nr:PREDICTED: alpha-N-acetylgalactosaminide alpha-2,6-sialyltransferase 5-like [Branchiostoma belcheri]
MCVVYLPAYLYLGKLETQPLHHPTSTSKRLLQQTDVPNKIVRPTRPPGPVHPTPFNVTHPLSGYVNVIKDREPLKLRCRDCALVFNSGQLLGHQAGPDIDQSDCVVRMNDAPVTGFEKHVGTRTTVRVLAHSGVPSFSNHSANFTREGLKVVGWGPDDTMKTDGKGKTYNILSKLATEHPDNIQVYVLTPPRMKYADKVFETETGKPRLGSGSWLSTGWFAMILATEMCDRVKVFGMSNGEYCRDPHAHPVPYHYFNKYGGNECQEYRKMERQRSDTHRFFAEKKVFEIWSKYHKITFHYPTWRPK